MEIEPDDPAEGERAVTRYQALIALYPRDLVLGMIQAYYEALPPVDDVMLPGMSAEELEAEMSKEFAVPDDTPPEALAELEQLKQGFRDIRGKKEIGRAHV